MFCVRPGAAGTLRERAGYHTRQDDSSTYHALYMAETILARLALYRREPGHCVYWEGGFRCVVGCASPSYCSSLSFATLYSACS